MPYAMGRHVSENTMYALFKGGIVRSIGPEEKKLFDSKNIPIIRTESDVEYKKWQQAAGDA